MLTKEQAMKLVEIGFPGVKAKDCFKYKNLYLVRVEQPSPDETNYDPFFSVDLNNFEVKEFSVINDGDPVEIAKAFEKRNS